MMVDWTLVIGLMGSSIAFACPLLLASLGETVVERGGILNLGIEGAMLIGAFSGFIGAVATGSLYAGMVIAITAGIMTVLLFALLVVRFNLDQVVCGLAVNFLASGFVIYFLRIAFPKGGTPSLANLINPFPIPLLSQIPVIGSILFDQSGFFYLALLLVPTIYYLLFRTAFGLRLRSVGENPMIASYLGIDVSRIRFSSLFLEGALVGLAGSCITLSQFNTFDTSLTSGLGFISVSIVILGRWNPIGSLIGSLLFGFTEALSLWAATFLTGSQAVSLGQLLTLLPFVTVLVALVVGGRMSRGPASLGNPFSKE
jgi:simple sugar transport system permease protein